jgi:FMN-dependent oxidoreductase (nitrilotriacetate monooxygenase family)
MTRRMRLVAYLKTGPTANHGGGWRHPDSRLDDILRPERYEAIARLLEGACFDAAFFADAFGLPDIHGGSYDSYLRLGGQISYLDPLTVLPLMARVTRQLGLGATLSTTFFHPYHLARTLASLDILSEGRLAWNVVTSATDYEARNFGGAAIPPRDERYDRADEVMEACQALWNGWEADAFVKDKQAGVFIDPTKVHRADYEGRHVSTRGPLSIPRSPQVGPLIMQAGSSARGRDFATRWAELIFITTAGRDDAAAYVADIRARMEQAGRRPAPVLPACSVVVADTRAEAEDRAAALNALVEPELEMAVNSNLIGVDLTRPIPAEGVTRQGIQGSWDRVAASAAKQGVSFVEATKKPRSLMVGSAQDVADQMEDWFTAEACDGFVLWPTHFPAMFEDVARLLVPELQRRELVQKKYRDGTLRDKISI